MDEIMMYLAQNYKTFIVISVILLLTIVGYIVDEKERKNGGSKIDKIDNTEKDIHELAMNMGNKSLNSLFTDPNEQKND